MEKNPFSCAVLVKFCLCSLLLTLPLYGQNLVSNSSFESYSTAPDDQGQITRATGWEEVVVSADYMNTTYACWSPEIGGVYSGTGFAGFASYGDPGGSSEAIGQDISANPILPGITYSIRLHAKKSHSGFYSANCGGVELTGFNIPPVLGSLGIHPESLAGCNVLWISPPVFDSIWGYYSGCFQSTTPINYIVFSTEKNINCPQYIFIDSLEIKAQSASSFTLGNDTSICTGQTFLLDATYLGATYVWQDNSTNPTYPVTQAGTYFVTISAGGCQLKDTVQITELNCSATVIVPNVFTPNGDGANDFFYPIIVGEYTNPELIIYNRWGEPLFQDDSFTPGWDGKTNGVESPEGVYYWVIKFTDSSGVTIEKSGNLSLFRTP